MSGAEEAHPYLSSCLLCCPVSFPVGRSLLQELGLGGRGIEELESGDQRLTGSHLSPLLSEAQHPRLLTPLILLAGQLAPAGRAYPLRYQRHDSTHT